MTGMFISLNACLLQRANRDFAHQGRIIDDQRA
jgi:hypothetical protein